MPRQAVVYWGPVALSRGFDFTFAPGIMPSVCNIQTTVEAIGALPNTGTLTFYQKDDSGAPLDGPFEFPDCLLEAPKITVTPEARLVTLPVLDRRWKWRYGWIDGSYNVPEPDGVSLRREKTPQELAALLLDKMHETGYDVSRMPDDEHSRPHVEWNSAHPATELDQLCQSLGCIIVLNPLSNAVEIWPEGDGRETPPLPTDWAISGAGFAPVYLSQPHDVIIEAGPTLFQMTFDTEAVGREVNNAYKPIDSLSYTPDAIYKWKKTWPSLGFSNFVFGTYTDGERTLELSSLADETVFRAYRITGISGIGGWAPPLLVGDDLEPQSLKDLRLFDTLADDEVSEDGAIRPLQAVAYAKYTPINFDKKTLLRAVRYAFNVSLDPIHGIVLLPEALVFYNPFSQDVSPAIVRVELSFYAGHDGVFDRKFVTSDTGSGVDTPAYLIARPDIQRRIIYRHDDDGTITGTPEDNELDCDDRLNYWLDAELAQYGPNDGGTANYESLVPLSPDGLIQQITWSGSTQDGPRTVASAAQRHNRYTAPLESQRHGIVIPKVEKQLAQIDKAIKATGDLDRLSIA